MNNQETIITDSRSALVDLLSESCLELFAGYEVTLTSNEQLKDREENDISLIALIGLSEHFFRASLTVCVTTKLLKTSFPASEEEITEGDLQDWLGELANQLAGRFKNKVVPYGCKLELGVPTVIEGAHLKIDLPKSSTISKHHFITEQGEVVELNLSTLIDDQFVLHTPEESEETEVLAEGEMLFF